MITFYGIKDSNRDLTHCKIIIILKETEQFAVSISKIINTDNQRFSSSTVAYCSLPELLFAKNSLEQPVIEESFGSFLFDARTL